MTVEIKRPGGTEIVLTGPGAEVCVVLNTLLDRRKLETASTSGVKLTEEEKEYLTRQYVNGYRWIVRDEDGDLFVFKGKPVRAGDIWGNPHIDCAGAPSALFLFIDASADEPTEIEPLIRAMTREETAHE